MKSIGECARCLRPLRPSHGSIRDWPSTIAYGRHGLCSTCAKRDRDLDDIALVGGRWLGDRGIQRWQEDE